MPRRQRSLLFWLASVSVLFLTRIVNTNSLATPGRGSSESGASSSASVFDRFSVVCPTDRSSIAQFDPSLLSLNEKDDESVWAAVYRSNNNQPSVLVRDEFLQSMRLAIDTPLVTNADNTGTSSSNKDKDMSSNLIETTASPMAQTKPVAIACLRPSEHFDGCFVLDQMRCILKKEDTNADCDGGSEHTEALLTAIDALLLHYLSSHDNDDSSSLRFDSVLRTKGTLVSGVLLEGRGFREVETLQKDMVTHVSSLDDCLERYAAQSVETSAPGARSRALSIVALLGRIPREADLEAARDMVLGDGDNANTNDSDDDDGGYNPWGNVNIL